MITRRTVVMSSVSVLALGALGSIGIHAATPYAPASTSLKLKANP